MKNQIFLITFAAALSLSAATLPLHADSNGSDSKQPPPKIQVQVGKVTKHADPPPSKSDQSKDGKKSGKS